MTATQQSPTTEDRHPRLVWIDMRSVPAADGQYHAHIRRWYDAGGGTPLATHSAATAQKAYGLAAVDCTIRQLELSPF